MLVYLISFLILLILGSVYDIGVNIGFNENKTTINLAYLSFLPFVNTVIVFLLLINLILKIFKEHDN